MDIKSQELMQFLRGKDVDCAELEDVIHAAEDVDISRVLWSLAYLRHTRDIELYKKDMPDKCQQAIQRVADLCAIQAHTDVAPEAWAGANEDAYSAAWSAEAGARSATRAAEAGARAATRSAAWSADAAEVHAVTRSVSWSAEATAAPARVADLCAVQAHTNVASEAWEAARVEAYSRKKSHYEWERDTLLALIKELMK